MQSPIELKAFLKSKEACFKWIIDNWRASFMNVLKSEVYKIPDTEMTLVLNLIVSDTINIFAYFSGDLKQFSIEIYILLENEKIKLFQWFSAELNVDNKPIKLIGFSSSQNYSTRDELVLLCEIKYGSFVSEVVEPYKMILRNFDQLLDKEKLCDVTFLIGQRAEIRAHIAVLAAASPYFLAMFEHSNTIETQKRLVDFTKDKDITEQNFRAFLEFIYGSKSVIELSSNASELLILADKFNVEQLREVCERYMSEKIDKENVVEMLILSDKYHCEFLMKKALSFAKEHIEVVKASSRLDELCKITGVIRELL